MSVPYDDLLSVGHIRRAHGLKGEVVVRLSTNREDRVAKGSRLMVPDQVVTVRSARPKDGDHLVSFEGITTREAADQLRGLELRAEPLDDPDEVWIHELIGLAVVDQTGQDRGEVIEVHANPASDLLVLDSGSLVPMVFVVDVESTRIVVDVPDGLFDL